MNDSMIQQILFLNESAILKIENTNTDRQPVHICKFANPIKKDLLVRGSWNSNSKQAEMWPCEAQKSSTIFNYNFSFKSEALTAAHINKNKKNQ